MDKILVEVSGRADGIIKDNETDYTIDEIKSTVSNLEEFKNNNIILL